MEVPVCQPEPFNRYRRRRVRMARRNSGRPIHAYIFALASFSLTRSDCRALAS